MPEWLPEPRSPGFRYPDPSQTYTAIGPMNLPPNMQQMNQDYAGWLRTQYEQPQQTFGQYLDQTGFGAGGGVGAQGNPAAQPWDYRALMGEVQGGLAPHMINPSAGNYNATVAAPGLQAPGGMYDVSGMRGRAQEALNTQLKGQMLPEVLESMGARGSRYSTQANDAALHRAAMAQYDYEKLFAPLELQAYTDNERNIQQMNQTRVALFGEQQRASTAAMQARTQAEIAWNQGNIQLATKYMDMAATAENQAKEHELQIQKMDQDLLMLDRQLAFKDFERRQMTPAQLAAAGQAYLNTNPVFPTIVQNRPVYDQGVTLPQTIEGLLRSLGGASGVLPALFGSQGQTGLLEGLWNVAKSATGGAISTLKDLWNWIASPEGQIYASEMGDPSALGILEPMTELMPNVGVDEFLDFTTGIDWSADFNGVPIDLFGGNF